MAITVVVHTGVQIIRSNKLVSLGSKAFAACRKVGGLLLVLAAVASPARAQMSCNVPEIDPGALTSAITLLVGGALVLADRFRR